MVPVMGDHVILRPQSGHRADRDGLLPDVKMQESADLSLAVRLFRPFLETSDQAHLPEPVERFLFGRIDPGRILSGNARRRSRHHRNSSLPIALIDSKPPRRISWSTLTPSLLPGMQGTCQEPFLLRCLFPCPAAYPPAFRRRTLIGPQAILPPGLARTLLGMCLEDDLDQGRTTRSLIIMYSAFMQYNEVFVTGGTGLLGRHVCQGADRAGVSAPPPCAHGVRGGD